MAGNTPIKTKTPSQDCQGGLSCRKGRAQPERASVGAKKRLPGPPVEPHPKKPSREELAPGEVLCGHCPAKCCRYFALPIDTPTEWTDFEYIRWFLFHDRAAVFIEAGDWYLLVYTKCKHLGDDNLCQGYETRPQICRDYSTHNCEYDDSWVYDQYFETSEQVEQYAEAVLGPRPGQGLRSPR